jgi:hypothetical protein
MLYGKIYEEYLYPPDREAEREWRTWVADQDVAGRYFEEKYERGNEK